MFQSRWSPLCRIEGVMTDVVYRDLLANVMLPFENEKNGVGLDIST